MPVVLEKDVYHRDYLWLFSWFGHYNEEKLDHNLCQEKDLSSVQLNIQHKLTYPLDLNLL